MTFLPFDRLTIDTPLPPAEATERLRDVVDAPKWFRWSRDHRPFQGVVADRSFAFRRIIHYRNSFLPTLRGTVRPNADGSRVAVCFYLHPLVTAFLVFWCCGVGGGVTFAFAGVADGRESAWLLLVPIGMLGFMYVLVMGSFWFEADKAKKLLRAALTPIPTTVAPSRTAET